VNFLPSPNVLLAFTGAGLLLSATPGPDMALFLSKTLAGGRAHGFAALAGAMTGLLVHTGAAALGLSALLAASANAYTAVKLAGALYLLWLAYGALRHGAALRLEEQRNAAGSLGKSFMTGLAINLTNPKIILFFVTFLPQFIDVGDANASGKFLFLGLLFIVIGSLFCSGLILIASRFVAAAKSNLRAIRWFDFGFAGLMGAFAARLIWSQAH
jgi:threonine/homoserine/homoserine lactone efflux protein